MRESFIALCVAIAFLLFLIGIGLTLDEVIPLKPTYTFTCKAGLTQEGQPVVDFKFDGKTQTLFFTRHFITQNERGEFEHWEQQCD